MIKYYGKTNNPNYRLKQLGILYYIVEIKLFTQAEFLDQSPVAGKIMLAEVSE